MNEYMKKFDDFASDLFLKKLPPLPENWKEFLVKFAPIGAIISVVLVLPIALAALGLGALVAPFAFLTFNLRSYAGGIIGLVGMIIALILTALSIGPLFSRSIKGWTLFLYSILVTGVVNLLGFDIASIIWIVVELYFLYQIKSKYH